MAVAFTLLLSAHAEDIPYVLGGKVTKAQLDAAIKQEKDAKKVLDLYNQGTLKRNKGQYIVVLPGEVGTGPLLWIPTNNLLTCFEVKKGQIKEHWGIPEGKTEYEKITFPARDSDWYILQCGKEGNDKVTVVKNGTATTPPVITDRIEVTVGPIKPDPGPDPGPTPPGPVPIPGQGFRVLIVIERSIDASNTMTMQQRIALSSFDVREYLDTKCVKENGTPEYRIIDKNVEIANLPKVWQDAMNRWKDPAKNPGAKVPWILVTNGTEGFEGELPANTDALLTLLKTYGK